MKKQINEFQKMQKLAGIIKENYNKPSEKDIFDYWSIMVDNQPEDVKKILTNLITGKTSFSDFMTSTSDDVFDSFKDELYDDESLNEAEDFDLNATFKASPMSHSYNDVLDIFNSYEDDDILNAFKSKFPKGKDISKIDYLKFAKNYMDDMSEVANIQANWISITDDDVYEKAGLV